MDITDTLFFPSHLPVFWEYNHKVENVVTSFSQVYSDFQQYRILKGGLIIVDGLNLMLQSIIQYFKNL